MKIVSVIPYTLPRFSSELCSAMKALKLGPTMARAIDPTLRPTSTHTQEVAKGRIR